MAVVGVRTSALHPTGIDASLERKVVSGAPTLRTTSSGADERWGASPVTLTIDPTLAKLTPAAKEAVMNAFGVWASSGATLPPLSFDTSSTRGTVARDGVNRLLYGPITEAGHEKDLAITISYTDGSTGAIVEADTIFNSAYHWTSVGPDSGGWGGEEGEAAYDLQNVATHEAGHFFGLGEDFTDKTTTMYYASTPSQISKRQLTAPDITVVSHLYETPAVPAAHVGCGARMAGGRGTNGGELLAVAFGVLVAVRRRNRAGV